MKKIITVVLLCCCSVGFAQTATVVNAQQIKGSDMVKLFPKITDPKIYDKAGNVIDSAKAKEMIKSFDYSLGWGVPAGQTEHKRMIFKVDHSVEGRIDNDMKLRFRPKNPRLWDGVTLNLKPLAKHTDTAKLQGKAIVLLFRTNQFGELYERINDVTSEYIGGNKFVVFAITNLDYASSISAQKAAPILNAHHIVDAQDITDYYDIGNQTVVVVTNAQHQITYAVTGGVMVTPRILNGLLKAL